MNKVMQHFVMMDLAKLGAQSTAEINEAIKVLDNYGESTDARALARVQLALFADANLGKPESVPALLAIARHTCTKPVRAMVLELAAQAGSAEAYACLADLALDKGKVGKAAYYLRCARRLVLG
jgi:hypothetical protein